jgi:NAD(P)-dependent dehydrogenase (short-subunit alcohol dehydrogenase family)
MKVALITGGLRGIGFGISQSLLAEGFSLALCGTKEINDVSQALKELRSRVALHQRVVYYRCDIGNPADRADLLHAVRADFPNINVLVNNAGVGARVRDDVLAMTEENYDWLMKINLQGPFFLTQAVAKEMIEKKQNDTSFPACIVNISSVSATAASVNRGEYCLSKAALSMGTELWAVRLAEFGIPVYEIRPGLIQTDMTAAVTEKYTKMIDEGCVPQRRWGVPADIGKAVAMLTRGDLSYSTGQVLMIDGGMMIPRL